LLELAVEDNGGGIALDLLDNLFEPYVTTKAKGTGLGLAIVKKIIEEHGGIIWAENLKGGARLSARLPLWREEGTGPPRGATATVPRAIAHRSDPSDEQPIAVRREASSPVPRVPSGPSPAGTTNAPSERE
jgi:hypothetical protein